jgi:hypothetical protein
MNSTMQTKWDAKMKVESRKTSSFIVNSSNKNKDNTSVWFCGLCKGSENWLADTGATCHNTMSETCMTNVDNIDTSLLLETGGRSSVPNMVMYLWKITTLEWI